MQNREADGKPARADPAERLRAVLDAAVDGILTIEETGRIESVNAAAARIFGYGVDELPGQNVSVLMPSPFREEHDGYLESYLATGEAKIIGVGRDVEGLRKDGTTFPMNLAVGEVRLPARRLFTGIVRDLTVQRAAEDAVAERDRQIRFMVEHLPAGAVYADRRTGAVLCNAAVERMTGRSRAELSTLDAWFSLLHGRAADAVQRSYEFDVGPDEMQVRTEEIVHADGSPRTVETARYRYDHHEVWFVRDVTEERRAAEAVRRERDFSRVLLDTTQACVTVVGPDAHIVRCNAAAERLRGERPGALNGRSWGDAFARGRGGPAASVLGGGRVEAALCSMTTRSGEHREMLWWGGLLGEAGPQGGAAVLIGSDVTELRRAQDRALRSERLAAIGETVAGLAHEGRNALQRARAGLDVVALDVPENRLPTLGKVAAALTDLTRLYEEVREYAAPVRLETGPLDLREVWRRAWRSAVEGENAVDSVRLEDGGAAGVSLVGDRLRLEQVFRNLFENAIAVSPPGGAVKVDTESSADSVAVRVTDEGPGLTEEQRTRAFEAFFTTKQRGAGLGLAISSRLSEAHGGALHAGRAPGGGAAFTLTLPLPASD
ncbi:Adaptive-response sensory-kinase SasA [Planctomycetes bacterium LzC2]|uniref:histidine kinase n=2 Tax=Alienimonas chondri TaxID=2681879 RepID=A0ABX1VDM5_9PLAN|nr:Adaptive-response sensory-kinase SasA [Alienimonas chondri]